MKQTAMPGLDWLTARPVAHRGLHDAANGVVENTPSAFAAAIAGNYAIECDLQISADGEAMVFHDDDARSPDGCTGPAIRPQCRHELKAIAFKNTDDRMITLAELCDLVAGRVTLVIEIKSHFDGDTRLAARTVEVLQGYAGPVAAMSFDPLLVAALRTLAPGLPRGLVAERRRIPKDSGRGARAGYLARGAPLASAFPGLVGARPALSCAADWALRARASRS